MVMKAKNLFIYMGVLVLGSAITVAIDHMIGVSFQDVGVFAQLTHKVTYMVWGGAILGVYKWLG